VPVQFVPSADVASVTGMVTAPLVRLADLSLVKFPPEMVIGTVVPATPQAGERAVAVRFVFTVM